MKTFMKNLTMPVLVAMLATVIPTSCKKDEVPVPPVELEDQKYALRFMKPKKTVWSLSTCLLRKAYPM